MIESISFERIETIINEQKNNKCLVLHGPPGIGKTSIALNFAWQVVNEKNWICLWFNSETQEKFLIDLQASTDLMRETKDENKTFEYRIQLIKREIRLHSAESFLIIFDNLKESEWIESFLTNLSQNVSILVTSTNKNILDKIAVELKVEYFDESQAKLLYFKKFESKRELSIEESQLLEAYFKYDQILPYDLNLLISELNNNEFINLKDLLDGYEELCEKIFKDLYERVSKKSTNAWTILQYCSLVDPEAIPGFFVSSLLHLDKFELERISKILKSNSVIEIIIKLDEKCFNIHRRTQEMVKRIVCTSNLHEHLERRINDVLLEVFDTSHQFNKKYWNELKLLVPNILLITENKYLSKPQLAKICKELGAYYSVVFVDFNKALKYLLKGLAINHEIYGENEKNVEISSSLNNIAEAYNNLGLFTKGLEFHLKSLNMDREIYGQYGNNALVAISFNNVAETFNKLGRFPQGLKFHMKSLEIRKAIYGVNENNLEIAISLNNIGQTYNELGEFRKGLEFHLKSHAMRMAIYGENVHNPALIASLNNLAVTYIHLGEFEESLKYSLKSVAMAKAIYGENGKHPSMAASLNNVASTYKKLGQIEKGLEIHLESLGMAKAIYGEQENHPAIAASLNNVAQTYNDLDLFQKGLEFNLKCLAMNYAIYGENENSIQVATSLNNIAMNFSCWSNLITIESIKKQFCKRAIEYQLKSIAMLEEIFSNLSHPNLFQAYHHVGQLYTRIGDFRNSLKFLLKGTIGKLKLEGKL
jgi:tetratricopeptide (TPR) repeat protein